MYLKKAILKIIPYNVIAPIRDAIYPEKIGVLEERISSLLTTYYKDVASPKLNQKIAFKNSEFKVYSKHGGDGILLYIFSKIVGVFVTKIWKVGIFSP